MRDHALIRLFSQTGLRVSEMVGLDVGHVFYKGVARRQLDLPAAACKGHRSRVIPLNQAARQAIQDLVGANFGRGDIRLAVEAQPANLIVRRFVQSTVNGVLSEVSLGRTAGTSNSEPVN